jgi:hypothetical protein
MRGRPVTTKTRTLDIPDTRWQGNHLGALESVPAPWSPLRVRRDDGHRVLVDAYARQYAFAGSALPVQIRAQGEDLLAAPLELVLQIAGRRLSRTALRRFDVAETTTATTIHATERFGDAATGIQVDTHARLEYDGLLVVDLEVVAPRGKTITAAALELPLRNAVARYRHRAAQAGEGHAGIIPEGGEHDRFIPYAWIGDDQRGLFWFCETDENWPDRDADDAYAIIRTGAHTALRFTIAGAHPLPARWRFRFGLQATPVKPSDERLEPWRISPAAHSNIDILWPKPEADSLRYYGYPEPMNAARFHERIDAQHARGQKAVVYSCLTCLSTQAPEYTWFEREWRIHGGDATSSDVLAYGGGLAAMNPLARSLGDFLVYKNLGLMETFGVDGFYHDNTIVYPCTAGRDGCGYRDRSGRIHPTFPILAYRDLYRRLYVAVKARWPDSRLIAHASGNIIVPILAYEDAYLDGETFRARVQRSYTDVLPLDQFRTEFVGAHFGLRSLFLPELAAEQAAELAPTRQLAALLLLHDVPAWPVWANAGVFDLAYAALDRFGATPQTFVPYYDPRPLATVKMEGIYVSGYHRADGRSLLIVANLSADRHQVQMRLDRQRLGGGPLRASVLPAGPVLPLRNDTIDLGLAAGDFQLIAVEPRRDPLP